VRTVAVFSEVLRVLIGAHVSAIAEAAFPDPWRRVLEPVIELAVLRIVHCTADSRFAGQRAHGGLGQATRSAHAVCEHLRDLDTWKRDCAAFALVSIGAPSLEVDTTDGYVPSLAEVAAFVSRPAADRR
jgi:hypothetical protein